MPRVPPPKNAKKPTFKKPSTRKALALPRKAPAVPRGGARFLKGGAPRGSAAPAAVVTADAGADQSVAGGDAVQLDGTGSSTTGLGPLTYLWTLVSGPAVVLDDDTDPEPSFDAPYSTSDETVVLELEVADGAVTDTDQVEIDIARFPLAAGAACGGAFSDPSYFSSISGRYTSASSQYLNLGTGLGIAGQANFAYFLWFRSFSSSWAVGALLARNASNQRQFTCSPAARGGTGEIQLGFGNGTTLLNRFVPDNTFTPEYWSPLFVAKVGTNVYAWGGRALAAIALTGADAIPATMGASNTGVKIGATNTDGSPSSFYNGYIAQVALWTGWSLADQAAVNAAGQTLWAGGEVADIRTLTGIPTPVAYVPHHVNPPTELIVPITLGGTPPSSSSEVPDDRVWSDELFSHRVLVNIGDEPFLPVSGGGIGLYSASPSMCRTSGGDILATYSRGSEHINGHVGQIFRVNEDEGLTWPLSNQAYPGQSTTWALFPHGNLTSSSSSKRSFTLTNVNDRIFAAYNETAYTMPSVATTAVSVTSNVATATVASTANFAVGDWIWTSGHTANVGQGNPVQITAVVPNTSISYPLVAANGALADGAGTITRLSPERRVWVQYSDDDGANWSSGYDLPGSGTYWNSVGRARIFELPDGSLALPYYRRNVAAGGGAIEGRYIASLMRSTDDGETWSHYTNIAISPDTNGGMRWEEPYVLDMRSTPHGGYIAFVRADSGADPNINGGASITARIVVRCTSSDGLTWSDPVLAWEGAGSHPVVFYRPSDGLMVATTQADSYVVGVGGDVYPVLRVSRDYGVTWSDPRRIDSIRPANLDGLNMQGDMILTADDEFLYLWCHEYSASGSPTATAFYAGIIRDCALNEMAA